MEIYQCGGRLHAVRFIRRDVQSCGGSASTPARQPQDSLASTKLLPLSNDHVMIPKCSTLWPIEDIGTNGFCYGWVLNHRLVCVAGVFQVGSIRQCVLPHPRCLIDPEHVTRRTRRSPPK